MMDRTRRAWIFAALLTGAAAVAGTPASAESGSGLKERLIGVDAYRQPLPEPELQPLGEEIPDWQARWEMARLLSYAKRYPQSIDAYRRVISERPELTEARLELARVLYWSGDADGALGVLEAVPADHIAGDSLIILGDLNAGRKRYDAAAEAYRRYLDNHPNRQAVRLRLAEVLSWDRRYDASLAEYETLLAHSPDDIQIRRKYALVLAWANRTEEAIAELKKTLAP